MNSAAIAHSAGNLVRYDPQAAQQLRDAAAQARERQQQQQGLRLVSRNDQHSPGEKTLEGELLNKQQRQQHHQQQSQGLNEEYLARHNEQRSRSTEGYQSPSHRAIAAYKATAQLTHPADVDQVRLIDVYV
jgi:hypothetical protein